MKIVAVTVRCKVKNSVQINFYVGFSSLFLAGVKIGKNPYIYPYYSLIIHIIHIILSVSRKHCRRRKVDLVTPPI